MNDALPGTTGRRRVYLMRHGEVAYFDADGRPVHPKYVDLTERGQAQARAMSDMLADIPFDRALCSGLPRTVQTAQLVLGARDLELEERPALKELKSGDNRGKSMEAIEAAFVFSQENAGEPGARFAGGEIYAEVYERVTQELQHILLEPGWRNILIVAHEGVNRMLLGWASYGGLASMRAFEQDPCCLNVIDADIVDGAIERRFIKLMNVTPENHSKLDNHLSSMEQVFALRRALMQREDTR